MRYEETFILKNLTFRNSYKLQGSKLIRRTIPSKMRCNTFLIAASCLLAISLANASVDIGTAMPDFSLKTPNGEQISLQEQRGHVVVLEWFNHNCPFVHKFYDSGMMQQWQAEAKAKGVVWLTIDSTNPAHHDFMTLDMATTVIGEMHIASTALLLDADGTVGRLFGATNTPEVFVISPEGVLIYHGAVDDRRNSDVNDVSKGNQYLINAIDAALAGDKADPAITRPYGCSVKYAY